jgi:hypothetical protein
MPSINGCGPWRGNMAGRTELTDLEFARRFEACELPNDGFHHRDHIRLAWIYVQRYGEMEARGRIAGAIRKFAARHGHTDKYHETMTVAWLRLVASGMARVPPDATFIDLTIAVPELLDKRTIEKFYSSAVLASGEARQFWVEPDLQPLP